MTTAALIQTLANIGVRLELHAGRLRVVGPAGIVTTAMRNDLRDRRAEILTILGGGIDGITAATRSRPPPLTNSLADTEPLIEDGRRVRWRRADERGCRPCKRCGGPIIWAQVIEDSDPKAKRGAFIRLDPDLTPHGCGGPRAGRFIDPEPEPTDGATTHDDK